MSTLHVFDLADEARWMTLHCSPAKVKAGLASLPESPQHPAVSFR